MILPMLFVVMFALRNERHDGLLSLCCCPHFTVDSSERVHRDGDIVYSQVSTSLRGVVVESWMRLMDVAVAVAL